MTQTPRRKTFGDLAGKVVRRFLVPSFVVTIYYFFKYRTFVSPRAEVELSGNLQFGRGCRVSSFVKIKATDGPITIGDRCGFGNGCAILGGSQALSIGDNLVCGPNVVILASSYRYDRIGMHLHEQGFTSKGTAIGSNVWIGAGAVILDGARIGDNSVVAANSVVGRRFPPNSVLHGNPAKPMRTLARG